MSDDQATPENVAQSLKILRAVVATFDERVSLLLASDHPDPDELARALLAVKKIVGATGTFGRPERTSNKPNAGFGLQQGRCSDRCQSALVQGQHECGSQRALSRIAPRTGSESRKADRGHRAEIERRVWRRSSMGNVAQLVG